MRAARVKMPDERLAMDRQLASVDKRLQHLVEAIATGKATEVVYEELRKQEAAKVRLVGRVSGLESLDSIDSLDGKRTEKALLERAADMRGLLGRHVTQTRQVLRNLLREDGRIVNGRRCPGRIICTPFDDARGRGYALTAQASYAGLLSEKVLVNDGGGGQARPDLFRPTIRVPLRPATPNTLRISLR
jgi:hypothetical protein